MGGGVGGLSESRLGVFRDGASAEVSSIFTEEGEDDTEELLRYLEFSVRWVPGDFPRGLMGLDNTSNPERFPGGEGKSVAVVSITVL